MQSPFKNLMCAYIEDNRHTLLAGESMGDVEIGRKTPAGWKVQVSVSANQEASVLLVIRDEDLLGWMWTQKK